MNQIAADNCTSILQTILKGFVSHFKQQRENDVDFLELSFEWSMNHAKPTACDYCYMYNQFQF